MEKLLEARIVLIPVYAEKLFTQITSLSLTERPDDRERTGLVVLVRVIGTKKVFYFTIGKPSQAAQFFVSEKATRSELLDHYTSQDSEDEENLKFAGSITFEVAGVKYQVSCSGLKPSENVFVSIKLLCRLFRFDKDKVLKYFKEKESKLPNFDSDELSYLKKIK